ncbi:MAG TPA: cytochrome c oxidase subunit II [Candidatus Binataceae bacterium]|nr:cytochrome c oxidase subunit II [Candidatus Binataceae bacterium]
MAPRNQHGALSAPEFLARRTTIDRLCARVKRLAAAPLVMAALWLAGCAAGEPPMTTLAPKSDLAQWIYELMLDVTAWDALVFVIVAAAFTLAVFFFSTRFGEAAPPSEVSSNLRLEVAWTVGPALILLMIAIPTVRIIFRSQPAVEPAGALDIKVIAHQWWWEFHYAGSEIATANEMHIPVGRPIRLALQSADVIHSFWVPQLGGKRDVVPGQINELTLIAREPGTYVGQCAEFCGTSHANMRMRVVVESPEQFAQWEKSQKAPPAAIGAANPAATDGAKIFANSPCTTCHRIDGVSKGSLAPDLTHFASRTTLAAGILPNTPDNVARWIADPDAVKPGAQMPQLGLGGKEVSDLAAYLESLK